MVARGGADNKGQHLSNVLGALDAARAGRAQWRVRVILDGEEEHGSPNLDAIARAHRDRLTADVLIGSDGPKQKNAPTLVMGVRGLVGVDLVADNGRPGLAALGQLRQHRAESGAAAGPAHRRHRVARARLRRRRTTPSAARRPRCSPSGRTRRSGSRSCGRP